jgi:hypothetical protein
MLSSIGYTDDPVKGDKYTFDEKSWSNADKVGHHFVDVMSLSIHLILCVE